MKHDPASIPFRRERLLSLGVLAFLAPIPLVFSYAVEPAWMAGYLAAVSLFLLLVTRGRIPNIGTFVLNAAGLVYAVLFYADLRFGSRRLLIATLHLLLFTTVVKLASIRRERDLAVALALIGFLFLAAVATSIHSAILLYLALFLAVAWPILVRWGLYRDLSGAEEEWRRDVEARGLPGVRATVLSVTATALLAVPLFFALPRLRTPFMRGVEEGREITTGFAESVDPDLFGILKRSNKVYLRVAADEPILRLGLEALRFRALAFTTWDGRTWQKPVGARGRGAAALGSAIPLPGVRPRDTLGRRAFTVDLLPLDSRFVPYPIGSPGLRFGEDLFRTSGVAVVEFDEGRNVLLYNVPDRTIHYEALFGGGAMPDLGAPARHDGTAQDPGMPRVKEWARGVIGGVDPAADPAVAAAALERELSTRFGYSLEIPRAGAHPTEEFLFERRTGHCENFASAMALALRELGIPSRFVTGFAGGELGFLGRYLIVRGQDAHAWVEAWCGPQRGWLAFDPTPPSGRPGIETVPLSQRFRQIGDGIELLYDRYVLSFGQSDQMEVLRRVREAAIAGIEWVRGALASWSLPGRLQARRGLAAALGVAAIAVFLLLVRALRGRFSRLSIGRRQPPATAAYRRLQRILRRRGAPLTPASSPAETLAEARKRGAESAARAIVTTYVRASFGGFELGEDEKRRLDDQLEAVRRRIRDREKAA